MSKDILHRNRTPLRAMFTKTANSLILELTKPNPDVESLAVMLEQLEKKAEKLIEADEAILELIRMSDIPQEEYDREIENIESYNERLIECRVKTQRLLARLESDQDELKSQANVSGVCPSVRKYKLPDIVLKKFDGNLREWLSYWGQFQKIDSDPNLAPEDKYYYLLQSTEPKSKARDIVESFPPTAESYNLAVEHMKTRFGKEEILVEVYIRDLLRLVLNNALKTKQSTNISVLYDKLQTQLRALESLGVASEKYSAMLYPLVESCLPDDLIRTWERSKVFKCNTTQGESENKPSRLSCLMEFLREEVEGEERIKIARTGFCLEGSRTSLKQINKGSEEMATAAGLLTYAKETDNAKDSCIFCEKGHKSYDCWQAKKMSLEQKQQIIKQKRCCFLCLLKGHVAKRCNGKQRCIVCKKRHFVLMCPEPSPIVKTDEKACEPEGKVSSSKDCTLTNQNGMCEVKLQTLKVFLRGKNGRRIFRALIDTGSQKSYISSKAAEFMGYESLGEEKIVHSLFGGLESPRTNHKRFHIYVTSLDGSYHCNFEAFGQEKICGNIKEIGNGVWMEECSKLGIKLTDLLTYSESSQETTENDIDILIGADVAGKLLNGKVLTLSCGLAAVDTKLGWTLMGKVPHGNLTASSLSVISLFVKDDNLADLWRLDKIGIYDPVESQTKEELHRVAYEHFRNNVKVNDEGRYEVSLPWVEMYPGVSDGLQIAERRLISTIKKLRDANIFDRYQDVLHSWQKDGVIEEVKLSDDETPVHYLPHRAVIKENATTKVRPVFDASAHSKHSLSLNQCLATGPNLLELIPAILTRFRMRKFGVISDIKQAFLQISLNQKDRNFLRFLWQEDGDCEQKKIYRHCRVVFGLTSSPFLLSATIAYHLENVTSDFKKTAMLLHESFYVDNCVASLDNIEELEKFIAESKKVMSSAKFDLRGWKYNVNVKDSDQKDQTFTLRENDMDRNLSLDMNCEIVPVLGLYWNLYTDTIFCTVNDLNTAEDKPVTKRKILSLAQKIFDPLGFVVPVTLLPKLLLQECWKLKVSWDKELPPHIVQKFLRWKNQLSDLNDIQIPRWMIGEFCSSTDLTLHVFADASKNAYATCIFIRVKNQKEVSCQLVRAKVRITPLKFITIPRLELLACCISARLADVVKKDMRLTEINTYFWTDSTNALCWIKRNEQWSVFVANRVKEIRSLSQQEDWRHVPGSENPADLPSRGCSVQRLIASKWWEGPAWLKLPPEEWPKLELSADIESVNSEKRKTVLTMTSTQKDTRWCYRRFSTFLKIIRMIAWMYRFIRKARKIETNQDVDELNVKEIEDAEIILLRMIQAETFKGTNDPVLQPLQPVLDENGIIRIKTRLVARQDTDEFRYPIVLPSKHPIISLLIKEKHQELNHAGILITMAQLREKYWIIQCRKTVRDVIKCCGRCRRYKAVKAEVLPAPLPQNRIRDAAVFEITGIDLGGPLYIKGGGKAWFVLFTCAVFRAIHIELVTSLSTDAFLQSLRRFIARRGRPKIIYSDNGTNFVGANNKFDEIDWKRIYEESAIRRIEWKFIPPTAAWWGGWWERLIRMTKEIMRRVLGKACLTYDELSTIFCETEDVINNRPLTYLSDELDDLSPLTPALFLREVTDSRVPDLNVLDNNSQVRRYRYRQRVRDALKKRFRNEYLGQLKHVYKSKQNIASIEEGQVVLIGSDKTKRLEWPLARVLQLYPGIDGHARVARLRTQNGELIRPIQRLYPLELENVQGKQYREHQSFKKILGETLKRDANNSESVTRSGRQIKKPDRLIETI